MFWRKPTTQWMWNVLKEASGNCELTGQIYKVLVISVTHSLSYLPFKHCVAETFAYCIDC